MTFRHNQRPICLKNACRLMMRVTEAHLLGFPKVALLVYWCLSMHSLMTPLEGSDSLFHLYANDLHRKTWAPGIGRKRISQSLKVWNCSFPDKLLVSSDCRVEFTFKDKASDNLCSTRRGGKLTPVGILFHEIILEFLFDQHSILFSKSQSTWQQMGVGIHRLAEAYKTSEVVIRHPREYADMRADYFIASTDFIFHGCISRLFIGSFFLFFLVYIFILIYLFLFIYSYCYRFIWKS